MKGIHETLRRRRNSLRERFSHRRQRSSSRSHETESSWRETGAPKLLLTANALYFDHTLFQDFREEGYDIAYLPHAAPPKQYKEQLQRFADVLEEEDRYAIVAYGEAASVVLDACMSPMPRLCAVVAYYPTTIPLAGCGFPSSLNYLIHLAESQPFSGKLNCYTYHRSDVGFAEHDSASYDRVSAQLAWGRTIACLRKGFEVTVDLAPFLENHMKVKFDAKDVDATMETVADDAYVNYVPVMIGGIGAVELRRFYSEYFIPRNPPSLDIRLISRTVGIDHVVDELYLSFKHSQEIPWILPGVPPTDRFVEIALVSVVGIRAGKLCHENVYWDQASVLMQIGLLDPKYIPPSFKPVASSTGKIFQLERLPVIGGEGARKVLNPESEKSNGLITSQGV
ncbi:dienelactone hydrolase [Coccidioides immitis RS]|uniref:Dienelactone hydrolase n=3 Tax=Coccidioides immitis TaxID=5501 RepID=J3KI87_COCIM|nr:dienelactone hydrolase [Coccidioides immitis RS]EAS35660.3 dienelactone hydrolase [Coccidioides immitis RS]KMP00927.1 dienelactone hydrolase [Coccidioides immitis RMSCC 2394]KMU72838.1 dienelactone hydrolase [Coccidioides immitis RMSCC 3703]TPX26117.1 hypothetical protein DIZ76_011577 [Coccidioides immitis]